jgi:hypothetical protein
LFKNILRIKDFLDKKYFEFRDFNLENQNNKYIILSPDFYYYEKNNYLIMLDDDKNVEGLTFK